MIGKVRGEEFEEKIDGTLQVIKGRQWRRVKEMSFISDTGDEFVRGIDRGKLIECKLAKGETVTSVLFTWEVPLRTIVFKTSAGQECAIGSETGPDSKEIFIPKGKKLIGIKGSFWSNYISSIALLY